MKNEFDGDLKNSKYGAYVLLLQKVTKNNCFNAKEVLKLKLAGDSIMTGLLSLFWEAVESDNDRKVKVKEGKLYSLIFS